MLSNRLGDKAITAFNFSSSLEQSEYPFHCLADSFLSKLLTFLLISSYMEYGATIWDPYQKYNSDKLRGCSKELQGSIKVVIQDTLVFLIGLMSWGGFIFLKVDRRLD